ncbi:MAG: hypothetical protein DI498_12190 [Paracoccus denitrificans]|nr:MAG: hypothetical protein DI498_12190 [Paracoccus denitrificans]PZO83380.1 MAG: hypothetical protein DI633_12190 [Paracoccus denitrificans]
MKLRLALVALPFVLSACTSDFAMPWDKPAPVEPLVAAPAEPAKPFIPEPTGGSPRDTPLEIAGGEHRAVSTADAATLNVRDYTAAGDGWQVVVAGNKAQFTRPGAKSASVTVRRIVFASGVEYVGVLNDRPFALTVRGQTCGAQPMTAVLKANGTTFNGCAAPGATAPVAPTASAAPAAKGSPAPAARTPA